ncbi:isocitrate lyase/PEP mutase family protein [Bradyrhizobium sp. BR 10289]|uniref:isocitrate lyase/PEP mutase family protein n=1 Tax=Bradyrhizobium sp. BR 10289 TaxID=2749993 RepID=UPI001C6473A7|nr:isocitrate lyase/PEP mutase family protein [Bradyrhizobium sp. BR 10289]MBW7970241.1 isocitrate lyase/PEP mutase family protein [Bradyrhizobium sp. BR 10289]
MRMSSRLRQRLADGEMVVAPGAYDAIGARAIEHSGFPAVYMTGGGTSIARGYPDYGLLSMSEMIENAAVLARSVSVPLIADADTGYGNELNVARTVREFENRDVAAIHLEDQVSPKRCGHLEGKELVPLEEFLVKVRAAVSARRSPDFLIIARTDARTVVGFDEAIRRANAALKSGADMAFVEAALSVGELAEIPKRVAGPCLLNLVAGGKTPLVSMADAQAMGYRLTILPAMLPMAAVHAFDAALSELANTGMSPSPPSGVTVAETFARFGSEEWDSMRVDLDKQPMQQR